MQLAKYSMGIGDRFGRQARAQMRAIIKARAVGAAIAPVWNKSNREHTIIGTCPMDVRNAVEAAMRAYSFNGEYHVDADHISLKNVDWFMDSRASLPPRRMSRSFWTSIRISSARSCRFPASRRR